MTIDSADDSKISIRTINTNRISNRTYDSKSNRITKLRMQVPTSLCFDDLTALLTGSFVSCTGWRLQSRLHSNKQSYKCLHWSAPSYLTDELCRVADVEARQRLRSSSSSSLIVSRTRLPTVGDWAFPVAAARVWKLLERSARSCHFRTFRSSLPVLA